MTYRLVMQTDADDDLDRHIRAGNKKLLKKIYDLFEELKQHPETGTGNPEYKKYDAFWARRISNKHRMTYEINEEKMIVKLLSLWGHYDDK